MEFKERGRAYGLSRTGCAAAQGSEGKVARHTVGLVDIRKPQGLVAV
jgi:hypothetical protein